MVRSVFLNNMDKKNKKNKNSGFTLVELMVATAIFMAIMVASMGALLITIDSARGARALRTAMDNVNFAMESMARSIRMGTNYVCVEGSGSVSSHGFLTPNDCDNGTLISFVPQEANPIDPIRVSYRWDTTNFKLERCEGNVCGDLVSPEVNIEKLNFIVSGSSPDDQKQANIYIIMKGKVTIKGTSTSFAIQTMASQRNF